MSQDKSDLIFKNTLVLRLGIKRGDDFGRAPTIYFV